jgi:hypothetical protein
MRRSACKHVSSMKWRWGLPDLLGGAGVLALSEVLQSGVDTLKRSRRMSDVTLISGRSLRTLSRPSWFPAAPPAPPVVAVVVPGACIVVVLICCLKVI